MPEQNNVKVYVQVTTVFDEEGKMMPTDIVWEDGTTYHIQKITDVRMAAARRAGGLGLRYTVIVQGRESYLFYDRVENPRNMYVGRWFVERK